MTTTSETPASATRASGTAERDCTAPALRISDLTVAYRRRGRLTEAVQGINLEVPSGGRLAVVGESGSGKTTVAMSVLRYLPRNAQILSGTIELDGVDLLSLNPNELQRIRGKQLAAVYQDPGSALNPTMTIGDQVAEVFGLHHGQKGREAHASAVAALDRVHLPSPDLVAGRYPHQLSGGQQQRVMIAMAVSTNPSLLILDEPTTGLDATVEAAVVELIEELAEDTGMALLMVSHNLPLVRHLCDSAVVMQGGKIVESGPTATLLSAPDAEYTQQLVASVPTRRHRKFSAPVVGGGTVPPTVSPGRLAELSGVSTSADVVVSMRDLAKHFETKQGRVYAVRGVDLDIRRGEVVAVVGESGSGKSTLARCVVGLESISEGTLQIGGVEMPANHHKRDRRPNPNRPTLVFQNPQSSLNPSKSTRSVLRQALKLAGDTTTSVDMLATSVQLSKQHLDSKTKRLSGGLKQRVAIARASVGHPALIVCDEPVSALDVSVQAGILNLLAQRQADANVSYLFISHDLDVVHYLADTIAVMYMGEIVERGTAEAVFSGPQHPYTAALMSASLHSGEDGLKSQPRERIKLSGPAPSAYHESTGCIFASRCPVVLDDGSCTTTMPPWRAGLGDQKKFRCHRTEEELLTLLPTPATGDTHLTTPVS